MPTITFNLPPDNFRTIERGYVTYKRDAIPQLPGIYVFGLLVEIEDIGQKFAPIYVGRTDNFYNRFYLGQEPHWITEKTNGNSLKAMMDFSKAQFSLGNLKNIYEDINKYTNIFDNLNNRRLCTENRASLANLIWYQNLMIYDQKLKTPIFISPFFPYDDAYCGKYDKGQNDTIRARGEFDTAIRHFPNLAIPLNGFRERIIGTKAKYDTHFYCIYARYPQDFDFEVINTGAGLNQSEAWTKRKLEDIGLYTMNEAANPQYPDINIDLSKVQHILLNFGAFGNAPLIL